MNLRKHLLVAFRWASLATTLLFAALFVISTRWSLSYEDFGRDPSIEFDVYQGRLSYESVTSAAAYSHLSFAFVTRRWYRVRDGWNFESRNVPVALLTRPYWIQAPGVLRCGIPSWMPLAFSAAVTVIFWWRAFRHEKPGFCWQCGYNLTGLLSGRCPECGGEFAVPK